MVSIDQVSTFLYTLVVAELKNGELSEVPTRALLQRVERIFGGEVYRKVIEQLGSRDHQDSCCSGLTAYLLGFQDSNFTLSIDEFCEKIATIPSLRARGTVAGDTAGQRADSNIVVFLHPFSGFPRHVGLFLGEMEGKYYEFGQWENGAPRFAEIPVRQPLEFYRIETKTK